jgi:hypothetical protein
VYKIFRGISIQLYSADFYIRGGGVVTGIKKAR